MTVPIRREVVAVFRTVVSRVALAGALRLGARAEAGGEEGGQVRGLKQGMQVRAVLASVVP